MKEINHKKLQTFLLAIFLNLNSIPAALGISGSFVLVLILCYLIAFYSKAFSVNNGLNTIICVIGYCFISILFSGANNPYAINYLLYGIALGLFVFCIKLNVDFQLLFKYVVLIGLILVPLLLKKSLAIVSNFGTMDMDPGNMMGLSYSILPSLLCAILMLFRKLGYRWFLGAFLLIVSDIFILMSLGSRGCWVVVFSTLTLYLINRICMKRSTRLCAFIFIGILGNIVINNFLQILEVISNFLKSIGLEIYAVEKMLYYASIDKVDNGRSELIKKAFDGFLESPFGHLIGTFEMENGIYAHNLILQLMWDYGIFGVFFILVIYIKSFSFFLNINSDNYKYDVCYVIFCSSTVMLLFSSTYWFIPCFWIWLKFIFNRHRVKNSNLFF